MRRALIGLGVAFATLAAFPVGAADTPGAADRDRGYALLSLVGDELTIVTYQPSVGSNRDVNLRTVVPIGNDVFDGEVLRVAAAEVRRSAPGARTVALATGDRSLRARQGELADDGARAAFVADVVRQIDEKDCRWLLLVTKHRAEARLHFADEVGGSGKLSGLGFYIDRFKRATRLETGESGIGYLAPYAYLTVSLVDLDRGALVRSATADESRVLSSARNAQSTDPWEALAPDEKVRSVNALIARGLTGSVPTLFAPR